MILSIHQPSYFPWLGLLNKIAQSDIYMIMDEVQLTDSAFQNRNLFLTPDGKQKYLTIPFNKAGYISKNFCELKLSDTDWQKAHMNTLKSYYGKHPFFNEIIEKLKDYYNQNYEDLSEAVSDSMLIIMDLLDIKTKVIYQSHLDYDRSKVKGELVIELVKSACAEIYLSGIGAQSYMDLERFNQEKIKVVFNSFSHPIYTQKYRKEFIGGLSSLDLLFNCGIENSRKIFWDNLK